MRPILKSSTTRDDALGFAEDEVTSATEAKRSMRSLFTAPGGASGGARRVTFSPFAFPRRKRLARTGPSGRKKPSSGFTFSSAVTAKHRSESDTRRQQELRVMETLYNASKRRPRSVKEMLMRRFPVLKEYYTTAKSWIDYLRATREELLRRYAEQQRAARRRRLLPSPREPWSEFDDADHEYMRQLARPSDAVSVGANSRILTLPPASRDVAVTTETPLQTTQPAPDLTPSFQGCFSNLLRRGGVPVDEDVARENAVIHEDLRGVGHAPLHLRFFRSSSSAVAMR